MKAIESFFKIKGSFQQEQALRYCAPFLNYFDLSHFWYFRVTDTGHYSYFGTNKEWDVYSWENELYNLWPYIVKASNFQSGINFMKGPTDANYQKVTALASDKYNVNFNMQLLKKTREGIEGFGVASNTEELTNERLINELPIITHFIKSFRKENSNLFHVIDDNQVDMASIVQQAENEKNSLIKAKKRELLIKRLGGDCFHFTEREKQILQYLAHGFTAQYIGKELFLSYRTVQNYIANLKVKLNCSSKVQLIHKAQEIQSYMPLMPF